MSVTEAEKFAGIGIRHTPALTTCQISDKCKPMPKPKTARMKIVNGRGYFYEVWHEWNKETKVATQKQKYLGKTLPKGYRLIK